MSDNLCLKIAGGFIAAGLFLFGSSNLLGDSDDSAKRLYLKERLRINERKIAEIWREIDTCMRDDAENCAGPYEKSYELENIATKELKSMLDVDEVVRRLRQHWELSERKRDIVKKYNPVGSFADINEKELQEEYFVQMTAEPFNPPYRCESGVFTTYEQMRKKTEQEAIAKYPLYKQGKKANVKLPGRPPYSGILRIAQIDVKTGEVTKVRIGSHFLELSGMSREEVVSLFDPAVNEEYRTKYIKQDVIRNVFETKARTEAEARVWEDFASILEENFNNHWYYRKNGKKKHSWINVNTLLGEAVTVSQEWVRDKGQNVANIANMELERRKEVRDIALAKRERAKNAARELKNQLGRMEADLEVVADFLNKDIILRYMVENNKEYSEQLRPVRKSLQCLADIENAYGMTFFANLCDCTVDSREIRRDDLSQFIENTEKLCEIFKVFDEYTLLLRQISAKLQVNGSDPMALPRTRPEGVSKKQYDIFVGIMTDYSETRSRFLYFQENVWPHFKSQMAHVINGFERASMAAVPYEHDDL